MDTPLSPKKEKGKREQHEGAETQNQYKWQEHDQGAKRLEIKCKWPDQIMLILDILRWTLGIIILSQMESTKQKTGNNVIGDVTAVGSWMGIQC